MPIETKPGVNFEDLKNAHPNLLIVLAGVHKWCDRNDLPCVITSLFSDQVDGRVSRSHLDKRAFDLSDRGWSGCQVGRFLNEMSDDFGDLGAISASDGKRRLIVYHDGTAMHFHIQVAP